MYFKYLIALILSIYVVNLPDLFYDDAIYQINKLSYSYTSGYGVNQNVSYKIDCEDKCVLTIKEYEKSEDDLITIKLSNENMDEFEKILNKCHILSWKGFSKSDKNVLDGDSFSFSLRYNDDEKVSASGYMMYPDYYAKFQKEFEEYVSSLKK